MNGRIYDPLLGRFLSADIIVQAPGNLQSYNRYSYVFNNPLSYTDPSGFETIAEHQEKIRKEQKERARKLAEWDKKHPKPTSDVRRWAMERGAVTAGYDKRIGEHKAAVRHIVEVSAKAVALIGQEVNVENVSRMAGSFDDDRSDFKAISNRLAFWSFVPGASVTEKAMSGRPGVAAAHFGFEVGVTLVGGRLGRALGGSADAAGSRLSSDVAASIAEEAAESAVPKTTRLFRAVEAEELKDVLRFGDYNIHPNSTFKRFAFDEASLDAFIKANPGRSYTKTFIDLPTEKLDLMIRHGDPGGVGKAIGIDVFEHPQFYEWFKGVNIVGSK